MKYLTVQQVKCIGLQSCASRLEPLMDALLDLEEADAAVEDPDIAADVSNGHVDVQMIIDADDPAQAMVKALATLRAAIHAIGDATPGCGDCVRGHARGASRRRRPATNFSLTQRS